MLSKLMVFLRGKELVGFMWSDGGEVPNKTWIRKDSGKQKINILKINYFLK